MHSSTPVCQEEGPTSARQSTNSRDIPDPVNQQELEKLTDEALLEAAKNNQPSPMIDAFFIGFLIGITVYGAAANAWGFLILLPLLLIYLFLKKPRQYVALQNELKKRNLQ
jgi:hypothetical protein